MNSLFTFMFLCVSVVLLGTSVQSRSLQRFAYKRENEKNPLCEFIIIIMDQAIQDADLNLTPEQQALLPQRDVSRRSEDEECNKERDEWIKSLTPFFESLSEEQQKKLEKYMEDMIASGKESRRAMASAQEMFKRAITYQRKRHYNDDE